MTGMTVIVKTITRWTAAMIFLYGIYMLAYGHLSVGGGFAGGVILACAYIIVTLAFGHDDALHALPKVVANKLDSLGALAFLALAVVGMLTGNVFFSDWLREMYPGKDFHLFSAGIIPLANIAIALKVCMSLFLIFFILGSLRLIEKGDRMDFSSEEVD